MTTTASDQDQVRFSDQVTSPQRRADYETSGVWDDLTLSSHIRRFARTRGDHLAVVAPDGDRRRTYRQLDADVDHMVAHLRAAGIKPGDVVAVQLPNWYETAVVDVAVQRAGAIINPMVTIYRRHELQHMLRIAGTSLLITPGVYRNFDHGAMASDLTGILPTLATLTIPDPTEEPGRFDSWLAGSPDPSPPAARPAQAVSELLFSSGTEAAPKAIMHTEQTVGFAVRTLGTSLGLRDNDVIWMPSPLGHSTGFNYGMRVAFHHGLPLVLQDRWDPRVAADLVIAETCTFTVAASTFLNDLVRHCSASGQMLSSMRLFCSGGAPVPADLVGRAEERGMTVLRLYGSTEALTSTCNRPTSPREKRLGTDGEPLDGFEVEVRDDSNRSVMGLPGEIVVRSPGCSVGFLADPERTAKTYEPDGWVRSGDLGIIDDEGYLSVVGRKKEIIIRGGMNVAPREVEELVAEVAGITKVAVIGLPDERLGEIGCACVVLAPGATLSLAELVGHLRAAGLAAYKLPESLAVVSELPSTPSGKVQKHRLVALISESTSPDRPMLDRIEFARP